ncbi:MAG: histidine kinase dimerization/phospho-acceptor domain-containing protein [Candidatus Latescibacteria bacterium]|jgi:signal transduction histidine kinase|nr:histidine kinase dimerization/phospho-acceptor domain-containing protein [Candidatus Latescibacterota bacterium]
MWSHLLLFCVLGSVVAVAAFLLGRLHTRRGQRGAVEARLGHTQRLETSAQVTSGIAHDLNNILAIAIGYGEMVRDDLPGASPARTNTDEALKAQYRARDLLEQFLTFSRGGPCESHRSSRIPCAW